MIGSAEKNVKLPCNQNLIFPWECQTFLPRYDFYIEKNKNFPPDPWASLQPGSLVPHFFQAWWLGKHNHDHHPENAEEKEEEDLEMMIFWFSNRKRLCSNIPKMHLKHNS